MNNEKKGEKMKKEESKVNFDLSVLTLTELVDLAGKVKSFLQFLDDNRIDDSEDKEEEDND